MMIDKRELLELLKEMIRIDSVNPTLASAGNGESRIAHYIGNYLEKMGIEVTYQKIDSHRENVIGIVHGAGEGRRLMLNGHTDTVSTRRMKIDPLNPTFENGKVYGRGSLDMKGGIAATIMAVKSIMEAGAELRGDVVLAFVADEEYASLGTETLLREYSADAAIICEPTDLKVTIAHKGFAWAKVEIFGKAAHGSLPGKGIDAIVKAGKFLVEIENLGKEILNQKSHPLLGSPSIHASLINGGIELSTYPDYCKIEMERRTLPGEDRKMVVKEIENMVRRVGLGDKQFRADFEVFFYRPALEIARDEPIVQTLCRAHQSGLRKEPEFAGLSGWLDSAILADAGIPTVIFGPKGEGAHGPVEYVVFDSVVDTTRILVNAIVDFCGT
ncbi:MAG: ArgE/DapE family deacylase [Proteobacteria bacterium]|nr:ArgE/DapE family deacylase [Pseudomonadota bacterium]